MRFLKEKRKLKIVAVVKNYENKKQKKENKKSQKENY